MGAWTNVTTLLTLNITDEFLAEREGLLSAHAYTIGYYYVIMPIRTLVLVMGVITNGLCIRAFYRTGVEDSVTIILFVQTILDFLTVAFHLTYPVMVSLIFLEKYLPITLPFEPFAVMTLEAKTKGLFLLPNSMNTTFLAVQRCLCVALPLQFKGLFTRRRTVIILASIFLFHAIFSLGLLAHYELVWTVIPPRNFSRLVLGLKPNKKLWAHLSYILFQIVLNAANQVIVTVCVIYMAIVLVRSVRFRSKSSSGTSDSKRVASGDNSQPSGGTSGSSDTVAKTAVLKESYGAPTTVATTSILKDTKEILVIKQVALVCTIYVTCNLSRFCYFFAKLIEPEFDVGRRFSKLLLLCYSIKMTFDLLNSSLNFFVYYKYNGRFRRACFGVVKEKS